MKVVQVTHLVAVSLPFLAYCTCITTTILTKMLPNKKYNIVYADPPWKVNNISGIGGKIVSVEVPYNTMTDNEIVNLPIWNIVDKDAILFLWCVDSKIPLIKRLMHSWGFEYKTLGFVWHKLAKIGTERSLLAYYTLKSCELCFIGTRGKTLVKDMTQPQFIDEMPREHSRKPDSIRQLIVNMVGDLPRIELFARNGFEGWDLFGDQASSYKQKTLKTLKEFGVTT